MRKTMMSTTGAPAPAELDGWIDLERLAHVELTSEDPAHPFENAVRPGTGAWRAAEPGKQTIRIVLDTPRHVKRVRVVFEELERERTQQVTLRWAGAAVGSGEIVRQQYTFSPGGATREVETWEVDLEGLRTLEIEIVPDLGGGDARATMAELRVG